MIDNIGAYIEYDPEEPLDIGRRRRRRRRPRRLIRRLRKRAKAVIRRRRSPARLAKKSARKQRRKARWSKIRKGFKRIGKGLKKAVKAIAKIAKILPIPGAKTLGTALDKGIEKGEKVSRFAGKSRRLRGRLGKVGRLKRRYKNGLLRRASRGKPISPRYITRNLRRINKAENEIDIPRERRRNRVHEDSERKRYRSRIKGFNFALAKGTMTQKEYNAAIKLNEIDRKNKRKLKRLQKKELRKIERDRRKSKRYAKKELKRLAKGKQLKKKRVSKRKLKKLKRGEDQQTMFNKVQIVKKAS